MRGLGDGSPAKAEALLLNYNSIIFWRLSVTKKKFLQRANPESSFFHLIPFLFFLSHFPPFFSVSSFHLHLLISFSPPFRPFPCLSSPSVLSKTPKFLVWVNGGAL